MRPEVKRWMHEYGTAVVNPEVLLNNALHLLATGGEVAQTLDWHRAVHEAKEREFGPQPDYARVRLAAQLVDEESAELIDELRRIGCYSTLEEVPLELKAAAAKEAADCLFVVLQAMHTLGVPFEEVYAEVLRSNWSKLEGGQPKFREDGKLLKSAAYSPADVVSVLRLREKQE